MTPNLIVRKDGKQGAEVPVKAAMFRLGRGDEYHLDLDDKAVSRPHAIISKGQYDKYYIKDSGTQNGTFLNGTQVVEKTVLKDKDVITIGPFEIAFSMGAGTIIWGSGAESAEGAADRDTPEAPAALETARSIKLVCLQGPLQDTEHEIVTEDVTIGRSAGNAIELPDDAASKSHASVSQEGGSYFITDLGSANGTFVQGKRITERQRLRNGNRIRIGVSTFKFVDSDMARRKRLIMVAAGSGGVVLVAVVLILLLLPDKEPGPPARDAEKRGVKAPMVDDEVATSAGDEAAAEAAAKAKEEKAARITAAREKAATAAAAMRAKQEAARIAAAQEKAAREKTAADAAAMKAEGEAARIAAAQEKAAKEKIAADAAAMKAEGEAARIAAAQEKAAREKAAAEAAAMKAEGEAARIAAAQEKAAREKAAAEAAAMKAEGEAAATGASALFDPTKRITLDQEITFDTY